MSDEILVSINCITYNHEDYISDAIESFLMQKTTFNYEILIHDDFSTDRTPEIIESYREKYPELIKVIFQQENQYSKGVKLLNFNQKNANGRYIAVCEGDDYWSDIYKLEKQVRYMENHPDCSISVHSSIVIDADTDQYLFSIKPSSLNKIYTVEEVIEGGGGLFATNSMMFKREFVGIMPNFYFNAPVEDFPLLLSLAMQGEVHYLNENMSVYRWASKNSWTKLVIKDSEKIKNHYEKIDSMLTEIDIYTNYYYSEAIEKRKLINRLQVLIAERKLFEIFFGKTYRIFKSYTLKHRVAIVLNCLLPRLYKKILKIKRRTNNA